MWQPPGETVGACIAWWADQTPEAPALLGVSGEVISYGRLRAFLERTARDFATLGIGTTDRVLLALPDGVTHALLLLATMNGAVAVPVNPAQSLPEAAAILALIRPRAVVALRGAETAFRKAARVAGVPLLEAEADGPLRPGRGSAAPVAAPAAPPGADDPALILLTSGTTERPRGVPVNNGPLLETCAARVAIRRFTARDRALNTAPGSFVVGVARTVEAVISGGSAIVAAPAEVIPGAAAIGALRPTWLWAGTALLESIVTAAADNPAFARWPLRMVRSGGSRLHPDLTARVEALWGQPVLNGYGTTETLGFISAEEHPERIPRKPGSAGLIRPGLPVVIRADDGTALPAGETGEITVRTGRLFAGYLDDPEATAAAFFPGGWYRTGDLGFLDTEGYLFVTGRLREMINRGGEKIAPYEVDDVLRAHPLIADAAAFALPDPRLGEEVAAAVVLREDGAITARELRRWLARRLSPHKIPRTIRFVTELPRTGSAKVQRGVLAERFRNDADG